MSRRAITVDPPAGQEAAAPRPEFGLAWALTCDLVVASERSVTVPAFTTAAFADSVQALLK